ncbi:MAG: chromatin protein Cren7 [Desulfurococcales archaeon ex4484_58]|nr:MAG: chromatin protein Cren7 [Desulfurococcales archaeon ex4484_58]
MPRRKRGKECPVCGSTDIEVVKSWQLVSPLPDRYGRITITVMGVMKCRNCGHQWKGVVSKLKVGGSSVEIEGRELKEEKEERRVKEIVLDLEDLEEDEE